MDCHTIFYAHIPELSEPWEHEFMSEFRKFLEVSVKIWETMPSGELQERASKENLESKELLKVYQKVTSEGIEFSGSPEFSDYIETLKDQVTPEDLRERQVSGSKELLEVLDSGISVSDLIGYIESSVGPSPDLLSGTFGKFKYYSGKLYRDTRMLQKKFYDVFQILDQETEPCFSYKETIERILTWNAEISEYPEYQVSLKSVEPDIYDFWTTYPDGIIEFGGAS